MLKKLIAGIASVTLALGMVALTATPASADEDPEGAPPVEEIVTLIVTQPEEDNSPAPKADDGPKVDICHWNGHSFVAVPNNNYMDFLNETGHGDHSLHAGDIVPEFDYVAGGADEHFDGWNFDAAGEFFWENKCSEVVEDAAASVLVGQPSCEADASVTPSLTNATWSEVLPTAPGGPYTVTAEADEGHAFPGGALTLDVVYSVAGQLDPLSPECDLTTHPDWPTNVTHTDQVCRNGVAGGSTVTVGQVEGDSFFDEVNYYLDGSDTALTSVTTPVAPGVHTVTASPVDPEDGLDGLSEWEFTVLAAPASCELTTLALTGAGANPVGWAGLGYYLLVAGLGLIAVRTVRRRNEVNQ